MANTTTTKSTNDPSQQPDGTPLDDVGHRDEIPLEHFLPIEEEPFPEPDSATFALNGPLWEAEKAKKMHLSAPDEKVVSEAQFNAILLSQAVINISKKVLRYGASNQKEDVEASTTHDGHSDANGEVIDRVKLITTVKRKLIKGIKEKLNKGCMLPDHISYGKLDTGLGAGLASYYQAGNCGNHAELIFALLVKYGYPGLKVSYCRSLVRDHDFVMVEGKDADGKSFKVIADGWPEKEHQAVLWEDHNVYFKDGAERTAYVVYDHHEITAENMGKDIIEEAFSLLSSKQLKLIKHDSAIRKRSGNFLKKYAADLESNVRNTRDKWFYGYVTREGRRFVKTVNQQQDQIAGTEVGNETNHKTVGDGEMWSMKSQQVLRNAKFQKKRFWKKTVELNRESDASKADNSQLPDFSQPSVEFLRRKEQEKIDALARRCGKTAPCQYKEAHEIEDELRNGSQVVLISPYWERVYVKCAIPGASPDHWSIAVLNNNQYIRTRWDNRHITKVSDLREGEKIQGAIESFTNSHSAKRKGGLGR